MMKENELRLGLRNSILPEILQREYLVKMVVKAEIREKIGHCERNLRLL